MVSQLVALLISKAEDVGEETDTFRNVNASCASGPRREQDTSPLGICWTTEQSNGDIEITSNIVSDRFPTLRPPLNIYYDCLLDPGDFLRRHKKGARDQQYQSAHFLFLDS